MSLLSSLPGVSKVQLQLRCKWRSYWWHQEPVGGKGRWRSKGRVQPGGAWWYCPHCLLHRWCTQRIQRCGTPQRTCRSSWRCGQGRRIPRHCQGPSLWGLLPLANYEKAPDIFAFLYILTYCVCLLCHCKRDGASRCLYTVHGKFITWITKWVRVVIQSSVLRITLSSMKVSVSSIVSISLNNAPISFQNRQRSHLIMNVRKTSFPHLMDSQNITNHYIN